MNLTTELVSQAAYALGIGVLVGLERSVFDISPPKSREEEPAPREAKPGPSQGKGQNPVEHQTMAEVSGQLMGEARSRRSQKTDRNLPVLADPRRAGYRNWDPC